MNKRKYFLIESIKLLIIGIFSGLIIGIYKYLSHAIINGSINLFASNALYKIIGVIFCLVLMWISYKIVKFDGMVQGAGLPQIELCLEHKTKSIIWYKSLPLMFINSLISFFCGIPVGSEAPSAFIGAMVGKGANEVLKDNLDEDIYISMGAGFSAAFLSPLAGVAYVFEESLHKFSIKNLCKLLVITFTSALVSYFINQEFIIESKITYFLNFKYYYFIPFVLLFCTIIGKLLVKILAIVKTFINKHYKNKVLGLRFFFMFILSIVLLQWFPILTGSGLRLIDNLYENPLWYIVLAYLIIRVILFILSANSMVTGGLLLPTLSLGALIGYLICILINKLFNFPIEYFNIVILTSMFMLFAVVNKTPITSFILSIFCAGYENIRNIIIIALIFLVSTIIIVKVFKVENMTDTRKKLLRTSRVIESEE